MTFNDSSQTRFEDVDPSALGDMSLGAGFADDIGLLVDLVSATRVQAHLDVEDRHLQPYGIVHGGVHATIIETLASIGAAVNVLDSGMGVVGVANQTDFLRAARGGRLDAIAQPLHAGRLQQLWQVVITAADSGKVVARGQVRLQVIDPQRVA